MTFNKKRPFFVRFIKSSCRRCGLDQKTSALDFSGGKAVCVQCGGVVEKVNQPAISAKQRKKEALDKYINQAKELLTRSN